MAKYKEVWTAPDDSTIEGYIDTERNALIPIAPGNADYSDFLQWQSEGGVADPAFTQAEVDAYIAAQAAAATVQSEADDEINLGVLAGKTYDQVDSYIDTNITDMATAKTTIAKLARIVLAIIKKLNLES